MLGPAGSERTTGILTGGANLDRSKEMPVSNRKWRNSRDRHRQGYAGRESAKITKKDE